jgi:hypothetical protein
MQQNAINQGNRAERLIATVSQASGDYPELLESARKAFITPFLQAANNKVN